MRTSDSELDARDRRDFATTRWSLVLAAKGRASESSHQALSALCEQYWYPLYAYLRRRGHAEAEAQDLTQGFFARLLEKSDWTSVAPERGRFRAFLLASLQNFAANEWDRAHAQKRGGRDTTFSLDFHQAESRYACEPRDSDTPQAFFEREWARSLLRAVTNLLAAEFENAGNSEQFRVLEPYLTGTTDSGYDVAAEILNLSPGAVKVAVHRMRRRFGELLRAEIAHTVRDPSEIDDEIRELFEALRS